MSIIRFVEGDFYIYATGDGYFEMFYRRRGVQSPCMEFSSRAELRAKVEALIAEGLKAPDDLLARIDEYDYGDC